MENAETGLGRTEGKSESGLWDSGCGGGGAAGKRTKQERSNKREVRRESESPEKAAGETESGG